MIAHSETAQTVCCNRMVTVIIKLLKDSNFVTQSDLRLSGFTDFEIGRYWAIANALARVALCPSDKQKKIN